MPVPPLLAFLDPRIMWATSLLVGTLLVGAATIALVRRWSRRGEVAPDAGSEMSRYRPLDEKGEISEEEYHRVRDVLRGQMRAEFGVGKPRPPSTAPDPPTEDVRPS